MWMGDVRRGKKLARQPVQKKGEPEQMPDYRGTRVLWISTQFQWRSSSSRDTNRTEPSLPFEHTHQFKTGVARHNTVSQDMNSLSASETLQIILKLCHIFYIIRERKKLYALLYRNQKTFVSSLTLLCFILWKTALIVFVHHSHLCIRHRSPVLLLTTKILELVRLLVVCICVGSGWRVTSYGW